MKTKLIIQHLINLNVNPIGLEQNVKSHVGGTIKRLLLLMELLQLPQKNVEHAKMKNTMEKIVN